MLTAKQEARFWAKVNKGGSVEHPFCWIWMAARQCDGYGSVGLNHRTYLAHRVSYGLLMEPTPLTLDHLCRNRRCVNPSHLEPVTHAENVRRGLGGQNMALRTHCPYGHAYDAVNTIVVRLLGRPRGRQCRTCVRASQNAARRAVRRDPQANVTAIGVQAREAVSL